MQLQLFAVFVLLCLIGSASLGNAREWQHVIYVDAQRGTSDHACWSGGEEQPCSSLDFAMEGAQQTNSSVTIVSLQYTAPTCDNLRDDMVESSNSDSTDSTDSCPTTWFIPRQVNNRTQCVCGSDVGGAVMCDPESEQVILWSFNCMTYDNSGKVLVVGACLYNNDNIFYLLPRNASELDEWQCGDYNKQGQLCGQCKEGFFSLLYDLRCMNCSTASQSWTLYFLSTLGPLTVFYGIVMVFKISATSPLLNVFILSSQLFTSPIIVRSIGNLCHWGLAVQASPISKAQLIILMAIGTFYNLWNLDFFRLLIPPECLHLNPLLVLALEYVVAIYPLVLILLTYVLIELHSRFRLIVYLWKPFYKCLALVRRQWDARTSVIDAFATFLLLSYVKLLSVSFDVLVPTALYDVNGRRLDTLYLFYDATIPFFGKEHLPYALLAVTIFVVFNLVPIVLLILFPMRCIQRCLTHYNLQCHALRAFMDSFQGCYKDGTDGTRDCRYFSVAYLVLRIVILVLFGVTKSYLWFLFIVMVLLVVVTIIVIVQPYKVKIHNIIDVVLLFAFAMVLSCTIVLYLSMIQQKSFVIISLMLGSLFALMPLCYIVGLFVWWIVAQKKLPQNCFHKLRGRRNGYVQVAGSEDSLPDRLVNPGRYVNFGDPLAL